nr:glycosyltransferase [Corynebacterium marambiense]
MRNLLISMGKVVQAAIVLLLFSVLVVLPGLAQGSLVLVTLGFLGVQTSLILMSLAIVRLLNSRSSKIQQSVIECQEKTDEELGLVSKQVDRNSNVLRSVADYVSKIEVRRGVDVVESKEENKLPLSPKETKLENLIAELSPCGNNLESGGPYFGIGPCYEYASRFRKGSLYLETFALRSKSELMRDVFARAATNMQFDWTDLRKYLWAISSGNIRDVVGLTQNWDESSLRCLARVLANQRFKPNDANDAYRIYRFVIDHWGDSILGKRDIYLFVEVSVLVNDTKRARQYLKKPTISRKDRIHYLLNLANLSNPSIATGASWERWLENVNQMYRSNDIKEISFKEKWQSTPLDSLCIKDSINSISGPLVSIIVPSFCGAKHIETTLESLNKQTWANIEIIVVDDCSPSDQFTQTEAICRKFSNVTLLRQEQNLGAYVARNAALSKCSGEYITVKDDDDWSHPQKIEFQVRHLESNPTILANMSRHVRVTEDLVFGRINNALTFSQSNFSSLMVRRRVFDMIGPWAEVNRGGDVEFRDRLLKILGGEVPVVGKAPLSFTRIHADSLTAGEMGRGYVDSSRLFYFSAYSHAHSVLDAQSLFGGPKEVAAPKNIRAGMRKKFIGNFDIVFATDFRFPGGTTSLTLNEIEAAADAGFKVGLIHIESPLNSPKTPINPRAFEVANKENVTVLSILDHGEIDVLVVRHPTVVQFLGDLKSNLVVKKSVLIANTPPITPGGTGAGYDLLQCSQVMRRIFNSTPLLVPETGVTRKECFSLLGPNVLASFDWPGFIDTERFLPRKVDFNNKPVVGRHSREHPHKWPDLKSEILAVYQGNNIFDVSILGGVSALPEKVRSMVLKKSKVYEFGEIDPAEYLKEIDFWGYFHSKHWVESFGMSIAEAMAAGCVVILPHYLKDNFGDGAVYSSPAEFRATVAKLWADPVAYTAQSRKARQFVEATFSRNAFLARIAMLTRKEDGNSDASIEE